MDTALVPHSLIGLIADESQNTNIESRLPARDAPFCVAIAKVLCNGNNFAYLPYKDFMQNMTGNQRISLCHSVAQEIAIRSTQAKQKE